MNRPGPEKIKEWRARASKKNAIVPAFFEVFPDHVFIVCGNCETIYKRVLIVNINEPTFACPNQSCKLKNWVPVHYDLKR